MGRDHQPNLCGVGGESASLDEKSIYYRIKEVVVDGIVDV
jgi:hypothetical protein